MKLSKYFLLAVIPLVGAGVSSASITFSYTSSDYGPSPGSVPAQTVSGLTASVAGVWANVNNSGATVAVNSPDFGVTDIAEYSGAGLGVCNPQEQVNPIDCSAPQHQIDNYNGIDFALFSFSAAVNLNSVYVVSFGNPEGPPTQTYTDVDLSYAVLTAQQESQLVAGTLPFSSISFTSQSTPFDGNYNYSLTGTGQYVLIGASVLPYYGDTSTTATPDAFKIQTLTVTPTGGSQTATPEPSSWLLIGSGLVGVGLLARRRLQAARG